MKVTIADATLQAIKDLMKKENKDALRINFSNFTWENLVFESVLDVQKEKDIELVYNDIKIIFTKQVESIVSSVIISHEESASGVNLKLAWN